MKFFFGKESVIMTAENDEEAQALANLWKCGAIVAKTVGLMPTGPHASNFCSLEFIAGEKWNPPGYRLPSSLAIQHGGNHYKGRAVQPVEYIHANKLSFNLGSVVKYATRHETKGGLGDLKKAMHFLQFELEQVYGVRTRVEWDEPGKDAGA